jgi:quinoprotein glucose dehydrogenase
MPGRSALLIACAVSCAAQARAEAPPTAGWTHIGGDAGNSRYSPLADIHRGNVAQLREVWRYRHGDFYLPAPGEARTRSGTGPCASRIVQATVDSRLIAIDAATGRPCPGFGRGGTVDLHEGVANLRQPEHHKMTSPPVVAGDVIAVGASLADNRPQQPSGDVRGYDARSGRQLWTFHVIPRAGEPGTETWEHESWREGVGANPWAPLAADPARGLVFVPTSTASPDFYGGRRPGDNLFADSLLALRAATGERAWHFQVVHHDLWDYDLASPPNLVTWSATAARSTSSPS